MCGRYALFTPPERLRALFALTRLTAPDAAAEADLRPRYNIAPTQRVAIVRAMRSSEQPVGGGGGGGGRELALVRWGLVPYWAKDPEARDLPQMINARAETAAKRPAFREALTRRRCLVPADGFYEWKAGEGKGRGRTAKAPMFVRPSGGGVFGLAGVWERWRPHGGGEGQGGEPVESCTILTVAPNPLLAGIHDRMPAIVPPADYSRWLDRATPPDEALGLLGPYAEDRMEVYPVSRLVNTPANDSPELIEPAGVGGTAAAPERPSHPTLWGGDDRTGGA
jgi:putative SOS response-associated peptidase YedK